MVYVVDGFKDGLDVMGKLVVLFGDVCLFWVIEG